MKVFLPQEVTYIGSNREVFFSGNNLLQFNLGTVTAYNQGVVGIKVNIGDSVKDGTSLAFNSVLDYTNDKDEQGQVNAYLALATGAIAGQESQFMASLIGLFGYLFNSWVFNLLLILIILFAAYYFYHLFIKSQNNGNGKDDLIMD